MNMTDWQTDGQNCYTNISRQHCCADARLKKINPTQRYRLSLNRLPQKSGCRNSILQQDVYSVSFIIAYYNSCGCGQTFDGVGREKGNVSTLEWIVAGKFITATLRLGFTGERRIVHLQTLLYLTSQSAPSCCLLPCNAMHKRRGLCHCVVSIRPSDCLTVCLSVTFVYSVETNKRILKIIFFTVG